MTHRSSAATRALRGAVAGLCLGVLATGAPGHGGAFRVPGGTLPPGAGPSAPGGQSPSAPGTRGPAVTDQLGWQLWWSFNREPFLDLKAAVYRVPATTGSDDFFIGRGERQGPASDLRPPRALLREEVVPALVRVLESEQQTDLVSAALIALGKVGVAGERPGERSIAQVVEPFLQSKNQEIAESAALALGILADRTSAGALAALVEDTETGRRLVRANRVPERTRAFAAYGLGLIGFQSELEDVRRYCVHHLVTALEAHDQKQRDVPVACVLALGLIPLESTGDAAPDAELEPSRSREGLVRYLSDWLANERNHELIRAHVPVSLARLALFAAPPVRARTKRDLIALADPRARGPKALTQSVVMALGVLGDDDLDPDDVALRAVLRSQASDGEALTRRLALISMSEVAARPGDGAPSEALSETRRHHLRLLANGSSTLRPWAALALGVLEHHVHRARLAPSADVRVALREALRGTKTKDHESACALALGLCRDLASEEALLELVTGSSDDAMRGTAAVALGLMDARASIGPLREVVQASEFRPQLLREGAVGLGLLGDKGLVEALAAMLRGTNSLGAQGSISTALGFIGDVRTVEPLLELLSDADLPATTRAFSAVALGIVCDKEPYPFNVKLGADVNWWLSPATLLDPASGSGVLDVL